MPKKSLRRLSEEKAEHAIRFISNLTHTKGQWSGLPFKIIPWEDNVIRRMYGTLREDGRRQYRTVYVEIPKKSGKTELGAAVGLKQLTADQEKEPEVYSAASDREQAGIVFGKAATMVHRNEELEKRLKVLDATKRIVNHSNGGYWKVLSRESRTKHGLNPSTVIFDELHDLPDRKLYDVLTSGTDYARAQQLVFIMTTAGDDDMEKIGWEVHEYARQVRDGVIEDPTFLPIIYGAKEDDDWTDEKVWLAANPGCGHIFSLDKIREDYQLCLRKPAYVNEFKRFRLNLWVSTVTRFIPMDDWDACVNNFDASKLIGRQCFAGLDLSSRIDMTALALCFPPDSDMPYWKLLVEFWLPEARLRERENTDKVPYHLWAEAGLLKLCPGNRVHYPFIVKHIAEAAKRYQIREVAYDPWNAESVAQTLSDEHGVEMVEHRQGYISMSEPCKEFLGLIKDHEIAHCGNRILRWNVDNLRVKIDESENIRPVKDRAARNRKRIDGAVASIMALGRAVASRDDGSSIYDERGLLYL